MCFLFETNHHGNQKPLNSWSLFLVWLSTKTLLKSLFFVCVSPSIFEASKTFLVFCGRLMTVCGRFLMDEIKSPTFSTNHSSQDIISHHKKKKKNKKKSGLKNSWFSCFGFHDPKKTHPKAIENESQRNNMVEFFQLALMRWCVMCVCFFFLEMIGLRVKIDFFSLMRWCPCKFSTFPVARCAFFFSEMVGNSFQNCRGRGYVN